MKLKKAQLEEAASKRQPTVRYFPTASEGLTAEQAEQHLRDGWTNEAVASPTKSVKEIVKTNLLTYFNLVFAVLTVLLIVAGSFRSLTFLPVVIANLLIGIIQELRAKKTLDQLTMLSSPKVPTGARLG